MEIVLTMVEVKEFLKRAKFEEIEKLPAKCLNCGHRDILGKFIVEESEWSAWGLQHHYPIISIKGKYFKKFLECPKCKSSLIAIDEKDLPKYLVELI